MRDAKIIRTVAVEDINEKVYRDPDLFVAECEEEYSNQINAVADTIIKSDNKVKNNNDIIQEK